jgi:hypothetical protein
MECKGQCNTTISYTVLKKDGKKWKKTTETYSSSDPCVGEPAYSPGGPGYIQGTDTETAQSYSKNENYNHEWKSNENCSQGSYNYTFNSNIDITVDEIVDLSDAQNIRRQAINTRLGIYGTNQPQNKDGAKCMSFGYISPDQYACWSFVGVDHENLYVDEELYSWKVRFKAFVHKAGLPPNIDEFKGTVHAYAIPAEFDEYGDAYLPDPGISNCNCGSKTVDDIMPYKSIPVSVPRDGQIVNWGNTELFVGSDVDVDSSEVPTQESFVVYCVEDTTYEEK